MDIQNEIILYWSNADQAFIAEVQNFLAAPRMARLTKFLRRFNPLTTDDFKAG